MTKRAPITPQMREQAQRRHTLAVLARVQAKVEMPPLAYDFSSDDDLLLEVRENLDDAARGKEAFANGIPINGWTR
jgi:hypothetical protein